MAAKTKRFDNEDAREQLDALRLANDWSFRQLSADMARAGVKASAQTLHQVLTDRTSKPYDRTLHKIRLYLADLKDEARKPRKSKGRAA